MNDHREVHVSELGEWCGCNECRADAEMVRLFDNSKAQAALAQYTTDTLALIEKTKPFRSSERTRDPNTVTDIAQARRKAFGENQEMVADMLLDESELKAFFEADTEKMREHPEVKKILRLIDERPALMASQVRAARQTSRQFWTVQLIGWAALAAGLWWAVR